MLHSSNNATIKLNSNVVTEFPIEEGHQVSESGFDPKRFDQWVRRCGSSEIMDRHLDSVPCIRRYAGGERGYHSAASTYSTDRCRVCEYYRCSRNQHQGEWIKLQMPTTEKMKLSGFSFSPRSIYYHRVPYKESSR